MYKNIYYEKKENSIHIWDDSFGYRKEKYKKKAFKLSAIGQYKTLFGNKAERVDKWSKTDEELGLIYESDIDPCTSYIIENYLNENDASVPTVLFYDIEVEKVGKYSTAKDATNRITAITAYDSIYKKYNTWILDDMRKLSSADNLNSTIKICYSEFDLLKSFIEYWSDLKPTIITGWNNTWFDDIYLLNRINSQLDKTELNKLSTIGIVEKQRNGNWIIAGVTSLDYLLLYKKFNQNEEASYKLDSISKKELNRGKVEYEGDLQLLYETDINKFIEYSIVDVELLVQLDSKLKFIDLVLAMCHECHVPYEHIWHTSFYLDGAAITYARRKQICLPNRKYGKDEGSAIGAFVQDPQLGFHKWVFDLDLKALYPSTIISYNISPETKMAKVDSWSEVLYDKQDPNDIWTINWQSGNAEKINSVDFRKKLEELQLVITTNGIIYRTDIIGLLPEMLMDWASARDESKSLMKKYKSEGDYKLTDYYNNRQWVKKIQSNSLYGVLLLNSFRFYDKDNGEAITTSSQSLIQFTARCANNYIAKETGIEKDYCLAADTDSNFYSAMPIINARYSDYDIDSDTFENACKKVIDIATEIQTVINRAYNVYAKRYHNCLKHHFIIKQEVVSRRSLWPSKKKRYAQWKVNEEGVMLDQSKSDKCLDIKGLDAVRSNFPISFRNMMKQVLIDILHDKDKNYVTDSILEFKEKLNKSNYLDCMIPTSSKEINKWENGTRNVFSFIKGTPIHYKAALAYNDYLKLKQLNSYKKIEDGDKILYAYLKENPYNLDSIAILNDNDPPEIIEFIETYIDKNKIFENLFLSKLDNFYSAMNWGSLELTKNINSFF